MTIEERLAALEKRVAALEQLLRYTPVKPTGEPWDTADLQEMDLQDRDWPDAY